MKNIFLLIAFTTASVSFSHGQNTLPNDKQRKDIHSLIDQYSLAREKRDTILLKNILTADVDQLVSTG
jgi:phage terminase Nu1 subunit (DNA packaging protein)